MQWSQAKKREPKQKKASREKERGIVASVALLSPVFNSIFYFIFIFCIFHYSGTPCVQRARKEKPRDRAARCGTNSLPMYSSLGDTSLLGERERCAHQINPATA